MILLIGLCFAELGTMLPVSGGVVRFPLSFGSFAISPAGITFSFLGFRQAVELAAETDNPKRNVPFAVVGSVVITAVIYILLEIAFLAAVPGHDLRSSHGWLNLQFANDFGPLAAIDSAIGLGWLAYLLYVDAVISPADTGLIYTTVTARISYAMGRNRNPPEALARTTPRGAPLISLIVTFVLGLIVFLPFPSWQQLVGFITSATVLSFGSGPLVLAALRRQIPDHTRVFKVPGGDVIPFLALYSSNLIVYWAGWNTNWKLFATIGLGLVLLVVIELTGGDRAPQLDLRAGATWILPWLGGLALTSWAGDYDGGRGWIGLVLGFVTNPALAAIVYLLALRSRLPTARLEEHIREAEAEATIEEQELGTAP